MNLKEFERRGKILHLNDKERKAILSLKGGLTPTEMRKIIKSVKLSKNSKFYIGPLTVIIKITKSQSTFKKSKI